MKKMLLFACGLVFLFISCSGQIGNPASGGHGSEYGTLFVQNNLAHMTELQIWDDGGAGNVSFSDDGSTIRVEGVQSWLNGVVLLRNDTERYFDFSSVRYMTFLAGGTMPLERIKVSVTGLGSAGGEHYLYDWADVETRDSYSADNPVRITIDLSSMTATAKERVERLFLLVANNDDKESEAGEYLPGQYVEISEIDYLDGDMNHVDISFERISSPTGDYSDIFTANRIPDLQLQVWSGTCTLEVIRDSGLRIYSAGDSWFGGAIVPPSGEYADFSGVERMIFRIRGTMEPEEVKIGFKAAGYDGGASLYALDPEASYTETEWAEYEIVIPDTVNDLQRRLGTALLYFSQAETYSGPGEWIEISSIDYVDSNGNTVPVKKAVLDFGEEGTWNTLFTDFDATKTPIDLQIWTDSEGNAIVSLIEDGLLVIPTGSWAGGGIVNQKANQGESYYESFDFSSVSRMEFRIKGTIDPASIAIYVQRNKYMDTDTGVEVPDQIVPVGTDNKAAPLSALDVTLNEDSWTTVSIDIPDTLTAVDYPLTFVTTGDNAGWIGRYFVIRDIAFYDEEGNRVELEYVK